MIKTIIKHRIAESAIDAFFSNMNKNFNNMNLNKNIVVGQQLNRIVTEYSLVQLKGHKDYIRITIYNATVTDLYEKNFRIKSDRPLLRENLSDGISQYINLASGYDTVFYDDIKYIE